MTKGRSYFPEAHGGEQAMGFAYPQRQGWVFLTGPSGRAGHPWNAPGPDAIAVKTTGCFKIRIIDNKASALDLPTRATQRRVRRVSAFEPRRLARHVAEAIRLLQHHPRFRGFPKRQQVLTHLQATHRALGTGTPLPDRVRLVVTSAGGRARAVSPALRRRGVIYTHLHERRQ